LRVKEFNTLTLEDYRAVLNTEPLGGEGVPLIFIVCCSIVEKNIREWYSRSITKEDRFCSSYTRQNVKGNSKKSVYFIVITFEEKRVE
jgi:hypothetical protein